MNRFLTIVVISIFWLAGVAFAQAPVRIGDISKSLLETEVVIQGQITNFTPARHDRAPNALIIKDATGAFRVCAWNDVWTKVPFRDKLVPGAMVSVKIMVKEFKGNLEGHVFDASNFASPGGAAPAAAVGSHPSGAAPAQPSASMGASLPSAPVGSGNSLPAGSSAVQSQVPALGAPSAQPAASASSGLNWTSDLAGALSRASTQSRQIFVFFSASNSEGSRYLESRVLNDPRITQALNNKFVPVRLDVVAQADLAQKLQVSVPGTMIIYTSSGEAVKQITGIRTPEDLLKQLQ